MEKLTEFRKDLGRYEYKQDENGYCYLSEEQLVNKLGKLEDLEEQLGCPLEVILKAVKEGEIYILNAYNCDVGEVYEIDNIEVVNLCYVKSENIDNEEYKDTWCFEFEEVFDDFYRNPDAFIVKASDYKKSWWLKPSRSE